MTGKNNPHLINRVAEWKRTSIRLRRSGNLQAVCGKNGTVQTVIGGDAVNFTVMLTGGTTFRTTHSNYDLNKFIYSNCDMMVCSSL